MSYSILIVEDDLTFSTMLKTWLGKKGFNIDTASSCAKARKTLSTDKFDLVLSDLRLPDQDGIQLLSWLRKNDIYTPFIIMTSYAEIHSAVEAMKQGASDFVAKPIQPDELLKKIKEAINPPTAEEQIPEKSTPEVAPSNYLEGESEAAHQLYNYVALVAPTQMSVLINGASGTGKEYVAHRIHQLSKRSDKPFVALDCGSIPKDLAASEFFGHVKGSFTGALSDKTGAFEEANGGTLFLDVDVRLVSATNENLTEAIAKGNFREDLYHRINEFTLKIPDLKDRPEDILLFANFFLDQANRELGRNLIGFDAEASQALQNYSWPGNLRQMKNVVKRATLLASGDLIGIKDLGDELLNAPHEESPLTLHSEKDEMQRILNALKQTNNNKSKDAIILGIDRKTLYNKMKLSKLQ